MHNLSQALVVRSGGCGGGGVVEVGPRYRSFKVKLYLLKKAGIQKD